MYVLLQTTSVLEGQWTATNYAVRKRLHEMEQAQNELEWQKKNVSVCSVGKLSCAHVMQCIFGHLNPLSQSKYRLTRGCRGGSRRGVGGCNPLFFRRCQGKSAESERSHALSRYATQACRIKQATYVPTTTPRP